MSFNNIEVVRMRIQEAQQNGMRDAQIRRILAEQDGEQKVGWLRLIIKRWIERKTAGDGRPMPGTSQRPAANSRRSTAFSGQKKVEGRRWTADSNS